MLPQKRQWCRRSSNEKLALHRAQAVAELSGTQVGLFELGLTRATMPFLPTFLQSFESLSDLRQDPGDNTRRTRGPLMGRLLFRTEGLLRGGEFSVLRHGPFQPAFQLMPFLF